MQAHAAQGPHRPVPALKAGDKVAIVAPSSPSSDVEKAAEWLRAHGFSVEIMPSAMEKLAPPFDYLAGTDSARVDDIHYAFLSNEIKAVWCLRGGFGATRLLDKLDYALIGANPKPFIGYSDITALHIALQQHAGMVTFHGPMLVSDLVPEKLPPTASLILDLLSGRLSSGAWIPSPPMYPAATLVDGTAQGRLVGGNLSLLCSTLGTPYEVDSTDAILFLEDTEIALPRLDRLLTQLRLAGKLRSIRGLLLGRFVIAGETPAATPSSMANALFNEFFLPLKIPVMVNWSSGHVDPNLALPLGATVSLDTAQGAIRLLSQAVVQ
ncbi:LD-carboxypeptidase [Xanthomonas arboricola]|uniref:LD-carboxypeptidase n=1 Tax=Xanthomonas campestris pv. juglandis TaxID=195709 RepID=A0A7U7DAB2_XANCJ|nr:peptidase S66 [Xanthomonas arboricola pv. juglandis]KOB01153.1 peptidase S66 [Xanthomonas arboricola]QUI82913.1 LD-carboxypeptidase [Xanthomonas arboricola pv. corylina]KOB03668.1 peptidase S66 [Xanthomonas arboricola]KOB07051.1 peptidase S66 [Xanthomonas arboricola]